MELPGEIRAILGLVPAGTRPFDRLVRAQPIRAGREAVAALQAGKAGPGEDRKRLPLLQSALYLYFDCFEEAHSIAQDHEGLFGNWLHAIAHRREPDAANAKYWYRRVQAPPALSRAVAQGALSLLEGKKDGEWVELRRALDASKSWEPEAFVDLAERWRQEDPGLPAYRLLAKIQEVEWRELLGQLVKKI